MWHVLRIRRASRMASDCGAGAMEVREVRTAGRDTLCAMIGADVGEAKVLIIISTRGLLWTPIYHSAGRG
jgi:hypothetical protein